MAEITIRVHQPVLGWSSGSIVTVEHTSLIQGLIDNRIAEVIGDPPAAPEPETVDPEQSEPEQAPSEPDDEQPKPPRARARK